ncbi:MAG: haloacid dehalogenase type II, partial [Panacagrimonas sp.]
MNPPPPAPPRAWVFDVYGTLLDPFSVVERCESAYPGQGAALCALWRDKQLQYTWLRSLMKRYKDFDSLTADALWMACDLLELDAKAARSISLENAYAQLSVFAEVPVALANLGAAPRWVLSNGTSATVQAGLAHGGIDGVIDGVLSVEAVGIYKPHPSVYALATQQLQRPASDIGFVSSNAWDIAGASA